MVEKHFTGSPKIDSSFCIESVKMNTMVTNPKNFPFRYFDYFGNKKLYTAHLLELN